MRTFYHGTVESSVSGILENGLQPKDYLKFVGLAAGTGSLVTYAEKERGQPWVYIGPRDLAERFANLRAAYLHAPINAKVGLPSSMSLYKTKDAPTDPSAEPALIRVDLPDDWYLTSDPARRDGIRSRAIPAKYLRQVPLSHMPVTVRPMSTEQWLSQTNPYAGIFEQLFGLSQVESY